MGRHPVAVEDTRWQWIDQNIANEAFLWNYTYIRKILSTHNVDWLICLYNNHRLVKLEICAIWQFTAWVVFKISCTFIFTLFGHIHR